MTKEAGMRQGKAESKKTSKKSRFSFGRMKIIRTFASENERMAG